MDTTDSTTPAHPDDVLSELSDGVKLSHEEETRLQAEADMTHLRSRGDIARAVHDLNQVGLDAVMEFVNYVKTGHVPVTDDALKIRNAKLEQDLKDAEADLVDAAGEIADLERKLADGGTGTGNVDTDKFDIVPKDESLRVPGGERDKAIKILHLHLIGNGDKQKLDTVEHATEVVKAGKEALKQNSKPGTKLDNGSPTAPPPAPPTTGAPTIFDSPAPPPEPPTAGTPSKRQQRKAAKAEKKGDEPGRLARGAQAARQAVAMDSRNQEPPSK